LHRNQRRSIEIAVAFTRRAWRFRPRKRIVIDMDANSSLRVRVGRSGSKYIWQLYREGIVEKVKYSGPIYISEDSAMAAGGGGAYHLLGPAGAPETTVRDVRDVYVCRARAEQKLAEAERDPRHRRRLINAA
jgi:hypothetical protein